MREAGTPEAPQSWILELRSKLGDDQGSRPAQEGVAVFVGLFVDEGQLWVPLVEDLAGEGPDAARLALPTADLPAGADPWSGAARAAVDAFGSDPSMVLRIGRLAPQVPDPALGFGTTFYPCVGAIPPPGLPLGDQTGLVRIPLLALASPDLAERQALEIEGRSVEVDVVHVAGHTIWGVTVAVLDDLSARLGLSN